MYLLQVYLNRAIISQPVESKKTCMYKDKMSGVTYEINDGEVSEIKKSKVRVCTDGKNLLLSKEEFPPPWKYACDGMAMFKSDLSPQLYNAQGVP